MPPGMPPGLPPGIPPGIPGGMMPGSGAAPLPPGLFQGGAPPFGKDFKMPEGFKWPEGVKPPAGFPGADGAGAGAAAGDSSSGGGGSGGAGTGADDHGHGVLSRPGRIAEEDLPPRIPLAPYPLTDAQRHYYAALGGTGKAPSEEGIEPAPKDPKRARALVVICYNRPDYLRRTLNAVATRMPSFNRPHIYVSQDGDVASVTDVITEFASTFASRHPDVPFRHIRHPAGALRGDNVPQWATGYYKLSQHFGWALTKLFDEMGHPRVIVLEDDLEIAVDFFDFFSAVEPLLDTDPNLLGAR
jgi:hypothetical protein